MIIGIVGRKQEIDESSIFDGNIIGYGYIEKVINNNAYPIGLITNKNYEQINEEVLKICDGIILPGGSEIKEYHFTLLDYCFKNSIPVLGICLGMQTIGIYSNRNYGLKRIDNHYTECILKEDEKKLLHNVIIKDNTYLSKILPKEFMVNSRHSFTNVNISSPFIISAYSNDNIVEAIEYIDENHFFLGIQWHPEAIDDMNIIFEKFINECATRKKK